jgi:molybdopterin converting factor small subunit
MRLDVLLFASYADAFGAATIGVTLPEGASVQDLLFAVRGMATNRGLPPAAVAVNQEYASPSQKLSAGDEIAIIPPVAGG